MLAGPYADTASYFLLVALSMSALKGNVLTNQSILAAIDAKPIRQIKPRGYSRRYLDRGSDILKQVSMFVPRYFLKT